MKLTRGGIARDFNTSPYYYTVNYGGVTSITFVFSSQLYKEKFINGYEENREKINNSLTTRFGFDVNLDVLCDVKMYTNVEKRGFLLKTHESFECLSTIKLTGETLITKS